MRERSTGFIIVGLLVLISSLCVIVFALPTGMQELLKTRSDNFNLLTFFSSTFVHANLEHLLGNLLSFLLLGFIVYAINRKSNRDKAFLISLLLTFFLLPLIYNISFVFLANFVMGKVVVSCGLSIVVAGIVGLTVPSLGNFLREPLQSDRNILCFLTSLILLTGSAIAFPYINSGVYSLTVFVATFILGFVLLLYVGRKLLNFATQNPNAKKRVIIASTLLFIYFTFFLSSLFPSDIIMLEGSVVNIFAHYIGVFYGIGSGIYTLNVFHKKES